MPYSYVTFLQARQALALRLSDPNEIFWTDAELKLYVYEALRVYNALTGTWITDFQFQAKASDSSYWYNLSTLAGSPRLYSVTDTDLYTLIEYHLLEPASGGTWTGTSQFGIADLSQAVQRRRDEVMQLTATGITQLAPVPFPQPPYQRRSILADNVLEVRRARYVPAKTLPNAPPANVLWREDPAAFDFYTPLHMQSPQIPLSYSITDQPPLSIDTNFPPSFPGALDLLAIEAGPNLSPPTTTILGIPNDWAWVVKYGAMFDLFSKENESRDNQRASYCLKRYRDGIELMQKLPWITQAQMDSVPVLISPVIDKDRFDVNWELNANANKSIIVAGTDLFSLSPVPANVTRNPAGIVGVAMQLIQNAPLPVADSDNVQVSRDTLDVILDYAEHIAALKQGGSEFLDTMELIDNFFQSAQAQNNRIGTIGMYDKYMKDHGRGEELKDPRFTSA